MITVSRGARAEPCLPHCIRTPVKQAGRRPLIVALAVIGFLSLAPPRALRAASAEPAPAVSPAAAALEKAVEADPSDAVLTYYLAAVRAGAGDAHGALVALEQTRERGRGFLPPDDMFEPLIADRTFRTLRARFAQALPRVVTGHVVATLSDPLLVPEGVAYDDVERALYVGSIARRGIFRVRAHGRLEPLSVASDKLDHVLGLAIDARERKLYAVSTSALTSAGRANRRNAIVAYDLTTRRRARVYPVPDAMQLNDVAVGEGFLLATDSAGGGVFRIALADGHVDALVPLRRAPGANGIAIVDDRRAYVAANRRPLRIDLGTGELTPLQMPPREQAAAIDGLYWHDGSLIGVQNVTNPGRVVRLVLGADGVTVTRVETLQSHHQPAFVEPTTAAPTAAALYVLGRTYVSRFGPDGRIAGIDTVRPAQVVRIPWR